MLCVHHTEWAILTLLVPGLSRILDSVTRGKPRKKAKAFSVVCPMPFDAMAICKSRRRR